MSCKPSLEQLKSMQMSERMSLRDKDGKEQREYVIRVPGGWIYVTWSPSGMSTSAAGTRHSVFVPEV